MEESQPQEAYTLHIDIKKVTAGGRSGVRGGATGGKQKGKAQTRALQLLGDFLPGSVLRGRLSPATFQDCVCTCAGCVILLPLNFFPLCGDVFSEA